MLWTMFICAMVLFTINIFVALLSPIYYPEQLTRFRTANWWSLIASVVSMVACLRWGFYLTAV